MTHLLEKPTGGKRIVSATTTANKVAQLTLRRDRTYPPLALPSLFGYFRCDESLLGDNMREFIGFVIAYVLYLGALWLFLESADLSIQMLA